MGTATSTMTFFRSMGGAIGTAVYGAVLTIRLKDHLTDIVPNATQTMVDGLAKAANSVAGAARLKQPMKGWALHGLVDAMDDVFLVSLPFLAIALILAVITPEQRLAGRSDDAKPDERSRGRQPPRCSRRRRHVARASPRNRCRAAPGRFRAACLFRGTDAEPDPAGL